MEQLRYFEQLATPYHIAFAVSSGLYHSRRYQSTLEIIPAEKRRYFDKSGNLAMCYAGFAQQPFSNRQALGAGKAAFLSCAYDVASDWGKSDTVTQAFENIVAQEASPQLAAMAIDLLHKDMQGQLLYDGLERGVVATRFVLEMMGLQELFEAKTDIKRLGIHLQIVDDVLDYQEDILMGDQNCLVSDQRADYLTSLVVNLDDNSLQTLFPYGGILTHAIRKAREQAQNMLAEPAKYFS